MSNYLKNEETDGHYKVGLDSYQEAVISAHFMYSLSSDSNLKMYEKDTFCQKSLLLSTNDVSEGLIPIILDCSEKFVQERVNAAKIRAMTNYKFYGLKDANEVGLAEQITEIMLDRQFLKGPRNNYPRTTLHNDIQKIIKFGSPIKMVVPALPYKSSSPLKTRGSLPDLAEISFLLSLSEIAKAVNYIYCESKSLKEGSWAKFVVISDGSRFNRFLNEPNEIIFQYQNILKEWLIKLSINNFIEILDYQSVISTNLPRQLFINKKNIKKSTVKKYSKIFQPILNPYDMKQALLKAVELDPDPEGSNAEGRFVPLFKSIIYIMKYKILIKYANYFKLDYNNLYNEIIRHLYEPYDYIDSEKLLSISQNIFNKNPRNKISKLQIFEYLRCMMLQEAWLATIRYIAEIKSDRDLSKEPIISCFPDHIRWTIHSKSGQLGILTTTANGDPVQPWHGVGVFKLSKNNKIKLYTLPVLLLEGIGATPVIVSRDKTHDISMDPLSENNQPLFYVYPNIKCENTNDLLLKLKSGLTRRRKI